MRVNTNMSALAAFNAFTKSNTAIDSVMRQLSTGLRVNSAADDAAGLAISEGLRAQKAGLDRALHNAQDGISLIQTAEGALGETNSMLQRMRELAIQAANDTLTSQDRHYIQLEIEEIKAHIDRIASTTQFNERKVLDGSICGTVTSTDTATKGYVRGAIQNAGNYRLEIKATPGQAQVQKSNIFRIKHDNVVTNLMLNSSEGFKSLSVNGLPPGNFTVSASKAGGGAAETFYNSKLTGTVTEGNTSGFAETMTVTFTDSDGNKGSLSVDLESTDTTNELVAAAISNQLNGKTVKIAGNEYALQVSDNGDGTYSVYTEKGAKGLSSISSSVEIYLEKSTTLSANSSTSANSVIYTTISQGTISGALSSSQAVTFSFTNRGGSTGTYNLTIPAGSAQNAAQYIASQLDGKSVSIGGKTQYLTCTSEGSSYYITTITNTSSEVISSISSNNSSVTGSVSSSTSTITNSYATTISGTVTKGNENVVPEKITLTFHDYNSGYDLVDVGTFGAVPYNSQYDRMYRRTDKIEIDVPSGTTAEEVAQKIKDAVDAKASLTFGSNTIGITGSVSGTNYTITTDSHKLYSIPVAVDITLEGDAKGATTGTADDGYPEDFESAGVAANVSLTGFFGNPAVGGELSQGISSYFDSSMAENNASILFRVTGNYTDELTGKNTLSLSAVSSVLTADGENKTFTKTITLTTDSNSAEIGSLLGEDDNHLTMSLPDLYNLDIGDKFVVSVSGAGPRGSRADTSLYVNGTQDSSWPSSWDDYMTYNDSKLYYNLKSGSVQNKDVHLLNFYLNSNNGEVSQGDIILSLDDNFSPDNLPEGVSDITSQQTTEMASFTSNYIGKIALGDTKLRDLEPFWNSEGVFMLEQPQVISITQNDGAKTQITLRGTDTLNDVRQKLNDAIAFGLGQGKYIEGGEGNNIVTFVETPDESGAGLETVQGTFLIRSLVPGKAGELTFTSDYGALIDALGLNTVKNAEESYYTVSVFNAHDNSTVARNVKTSGNILAGVVDKNVDIEFSAMSGVKAVWNDVEKNFILTPENDTYSTTVHIARNNVTFQTGTHKGEEITLDIGNMSSAAIGVSAVNVMNHERAADAIDTIDRAISIVSSQRSKLGTYQNALEHHMNTLTVTNENMTGAESRIRDADMSKSLMDLVKFRIINQSSASMLSQANQLSQSVMRLMQ
ncbi:MAG: hypothetical protein IKQ95_03330 [Synergistaceae bacterium]|nr:hypothetical protein [Synergistaceae bacterium]